MLHLAHHLHPRDDGAENDVLAVEMGRGFERDEELRPVGIGPCVGHTEQARLRVALHKVLVLELSTIDALTPGSISICEIAALRHKPSVPSISQCNN